MESNNELNKIDIKNRTCYYFNNIIKIKYIDFEIFSLNKKSYENILTYDISCKTFIGVKPLCIRFDKV